MKEIKLYKIHVFQYSKREGTRAEKFENQVPSDIKEIRSKKIIEFSNVSQKEYNESYKGKILDVLVEEKIGEFFKGHAKNYMCVEVKSTTEDLKGKVVSVIIKDVKDEGLIRN